MTNDEAAKFLRVMLRDYESYAHRLEDARVAGPRRGDPGFVKWVTDAERRREKLVKRVRVADNLLHAAGCDSGLSVTENFDDWMHAKDLLLQGIGVYEHGAAGVTRSVTQSVSDTHLPPATEPRAVTADDLPEMTLLALLRTLKVRHVPVISAAAVALAISGYGVGRWVEKMDQELAVEKVVKERDACRSEVATLRAQPEPEPAKPAVWGK